MRTLKQSTAYNLMLFLADTTDPLNGKAGLTLTITSSKDGAAFASITPTVTERGNGWYNIALTTAHTDTLGDLVIRATGTGAVPADAAMQVREQVFGDSLTANVVNWDGQVAQVSETDLPLVTLRNFVDHDDGVATRGFIAPGDVDLLTIESGAITVNDRLDVFLSSRASQTSVNALPTASANAAAVLAAGDVDGYSLEQTLKLCLAALAGKLSGAATSTITIRAADDSKNRITASVDQNGNRLLVTLDPAG